MDVDWVQASNSVGGGSRRRLKWMRAMIKPRPGLGLAPIRHQVVSGPPTATRSRLHEPGRRSRRYVPGIGRYYFHVYMVMEICPRTAVRKVSTVKGPWKHQLRPFKAIATGPLPFIAPTWVCSSTIPCAFLSLSIAYQEDNYYVLNAGDHPAKMFLPAHLPRTGHSDDEIP